jgi:hypothetical protein
MEAIRKNRIKTHNRKVTIDLPENFNAEEVDMIIWASEKPADNQQSEVDNNKWRKDIRDFYAGFQVDLSNFKFNRDELYDRA